MAQKIQILFRTKIRMKMFLGVKIQTLKKCILTWKFKFVKYFWRENSNCSNVCSSIIQRETIFWPKKLILTRKFKPLMYWVLETFVAIFKEKFGYKVVKKWKHTVRASLTRFLCCSSSRRVLRTFLPFFMNPLHTLASLSPSSFLSLL